MKEVGNLSSVASTTRKSPRRRMYHDAKFTTLLHPSEPPKKLDNSSEQKQCNGLVSFEYTNKFHVVTLGKSSNKDKLLEKEDVSETKINDYHEPSNPLSVSEKLNQANKVATKNKTSDESDNKKVTNQNEKNPNKELTHEKVPTELHFPKNLSNSTQDQRSDFKNPLFQKFLYSDELSSVKLTSDDERGCPYKEAPDDLQNNTFDPCVAVEGWKKAKVRSERRHTATGTNGLTMKKLEEWICYEKQNTAEKITKDDSEIVIAPKITPMKRAQTLNSFEWYERKNGNKEEEKSNDSNFTHQWLHEREKKKTYNTDSKFSTDQNREKLIAGSTIELKKDSEILSRGGGQNQISSVERTLDDKILSNGINNRLSCFLSPRPYTKDSFKWKTMSQPRKSWNGYEDHETHTTNGVNENRTTSTGSAYPNYIADDDDFRSSSLQLRSPRGRTKYDTFLDLSNLDLDDEDSVDPPLNDVTQWSDSESSETDRWSWKKEHSGRSFDSHLNDRQNVFCDDEFEGFGQTSARGLLEKIDEHPAEFCDADDKLVQTGQNETNLDQNIVETDDDNLTHDTVTTSTSVTSSAEQFTTTSDSCATSQISSLDTEQFDNVQEYDIQCVVEPDVINDVSTSSDSQNEVLNTSSSDVSSSAKTSSTKTSDSHDSLDTESSSKSQEYILDDEDQLEVYNTYPVGNKTASLDRYQFLKPGIQYLSEAETRPIDFPSKKQQTGDTTTATESNSNDKTKSRINLYRFYNIALSTINSCNRSEAKIKDVLDFIEAKGIRLSDPRLQDTVKKVETESNGAESPLDFDVFSRVFEPCYNFIRGLLLSQVTIPGFGVFKMRISRIFDKMQEILNEESENTSNMETHASYNVIMKQLRNSKPVLSLSVCTVDGQRCTFGSEESPHPLNACATVFNYCLACRQNGVETISYFLGEKSKPPKKTEFMLEHDEKVWNPFTKSGSILTSALLFREMAMESRLKALHEYYQNLIGPESLCCDNLSYNYKRIYDHEEIGLAYFLSATQRLPRGTSGDLSEFLDFHFQAASSAMTSDACAVGAATLANGGVCPLTEAAVLDAASVEHTLSVMKTSHKLHESLKNTQNDSISAAWSDQGSILIVIPGVLGMTCFLHCHSAKAVQNVVEYLIKELSDNFNFGVYRSLKDRKDVMLRR